VTEREPLSDPANHPRRETVPDRYGYRPAHGEEQPCLGCGKTVTFDDDTNAWWIPYEMGNPPRGTFTCTNAVFVQHYGSPPRFTPAEIHKDPRLRLIADLIGYVDLHIGRQHLRSCTTEQKEMWADLVDADAFWSRREEDQGFRALGIPTDYPDTVPRRSERWWREDYAGPTSPDDPRWHSMERHEPDPFAWAAEPLDEPDQPDEQETP
jgi:hypothetical protein